MAKITLDNLAHSYLPNPKSEDDFALKELNHDWDDGAAYALLGASGCGKSTLLNIISGLLNPSQGRILFDGQDVTHAPTAQRNIAQVFQFPVVYDTMSVYDNLAFPLRNRGRDETYVAQRVQEIARMIGMEDTLRKKALECAIRSRASRPFAFSVLPVSTTSTMTSASPTIGANSIAPYSLIGSIWRPCDAKY